MMGNNGGYWLFIKRLSTGRFNWWPQNETTPSINITPVQLHLLIWNWEKFYNHPVYWLETFVDTERFEGTCYKSANWLYPGKTKGLGKNDKTKKVNRSFKAVWGYPLRRNFRELLNR
jgi:hypothetical protein